jgi:hypothetical protein
MTQSAELINFKGVLKTNSIVQKVKAIVREKLQDIDFNKFKMNPDLILLVCRLVWTTTKELGLKLENNEKRDLAIEIYSTLFTLTLQENDLLKVQIDFFISNKQIKPISIKKKLLSYGNWFLKKLI